MKEFLRKNPRLLFYSLWLLLGLLQASLTELQDDEAYYWVYSKYLDWGYFDHPPLIAVLIKMGYAIFPNELGVRLFPLLLSLVLLLILEKLSAKKNQPLFFAMALSMAVFQLLGFLAIPDIPLLCFTALFLYCYKRFLEKASLLNTAWLGLLGALLLYSKYHGALIFLFLILSNPRLLMRRPFYIAAAISFLLFAPHLWWQGQHDWVSFRYHLFESNVNDYKLSHTIEYLAGQLLLPGPLVGILLLPAAFLYRHKNVFEKGLRYIMIGIYLFFLLSTVRGKVELNWTSPALIPLFLLSYNYLTEKNNWQRILFRLVPVSLLILVFLRVIMIVDIFPIKTIQSKFHSWNKWPEIMKEETKGLPIVFSNSYQRASKYWFYSGQMTLSQNLYKERRNNYNFWPIERELIGKPVYFLDVYDLYRFPDSLKTPIGYIGYRYDSSFLSFQTATISPEGDDYTLREGDSLRIACREKNFLPQWQYLKEQPAKQYTVNLVFFQKRKVVAKTPVSLNIVAWDQTMGYCMATLKPELTKGQYEMMFSIVVPGYNPTHNSRKIKLTVE